MFGIKIGKKPEVKKDTDQTKMLDELDKLTEQMLNQNKAKIEAWQISQKTFA